MIFNMVGGGSRGKALNFAVVGGTSAPSNPTENTIWVNTDTTITSWLFDTTIPSNPSEGMVWIFTGAYSAGEFNILTENDLRVYPLFAKQYINGAWVDIDSKSYQDGVWVDWTTHLYKYGDKCEANDTGSWVAVGKSHSWDYDNGWPNGNAYAPTVTWNSDNVTLSEEPSYRASIFYKNEKINLSKYNKLVFDGFSSGSGSVTLYIWSSIDTYYSVNVVASKELSNTSRGLATISIDALNGEYYVGLAIFANDAAKNVTMYQLYLC